MAAVNPLQVILGVILIASALGVILSRKPVHAGLSFLLTLLTLSAFYLQLNAEFIAVMQVIVYAGAILVIFMFVIVLFQDAHLQIEQFKSNSNSLLLFTAATALTAGLGFLGYYLTMLPANIEDLPASFGTVETLGKALYLDFFFPFEAIILLFLVAVVGAVYVAKKEKIDENDKYQLKDKI